MKKASLIALLALSLAGCQNMAVVSSNPNGDLSRTGQPGMVSFGLQNTDFEYASKKAVQEFLESPYAKKPGGGRWVVQMGEVVNDTTFRIDTASMTSRMKIALTKTGQFIFTGATGAERTDFVKDSRQVRGQAAYGSLKVGSGKTQQETAVLTDLNEVAGLEFDAGYKGVVAKAVISTVLKTTAQAAVNNQIDKQKADPLVAGLLKLGTGAVQYALTKADVRAWANLPDTLQMVVVDRPKDGLLTLAAAQGESIAQIPLQEDVNTLVLVKASGTAGKPAVYVQPLPAQAPVTQAAAPVKVAGGL